jgi:hypothetical protein
MVQDAPGFVLTVAVARDPFATGEVSEVKIRVSVGATVGWGWGAGGAVGPPGVGGAGVGTGVGASDRVGISATASVAAGDDVGDAPGVVAAAMGLDCAGPTGVSRRGRDATAAMASDSATTIVAFCRRDAALHTLTIGAPTASLGTLDVSGDDAGSHSYALGVALLPVNAW